MTPIRLLLVDDQALVRTGFRLVLDATPGMTVVAEAGTGEQAMTAVAEHPGIDVVLMDVRMPGLDGIAATETIRAEPDAPKVLILTTFDLDEYTYAALAAGASGFLLKDCGAADLVSAIRAVHAGDAVLSPSVTRRLIERFHPTFDEGAAHRLDRVAALSEREVEVLTAVGRGLTNQEIAAELFVAETTVKSHLGHILTKLDLRDRVQLVILAYDAGLVRPRP